MYLLLSLYKQKCSYIFRYIYRCPVRPLPVRLLRSLASEREKKQARPPTNLPESLQGTCHHVATLMRSVPLQSLLSEPLLIANMSEGRPVAGSKRAGSPQTCQAASEPRPPAALSAALRSTGSARECSELAWDSGNKLYIYIYIYLSIYMYIHIYTYIFTYKSTFAARSK